MDGLHNLIRDTGDLKSMVEMKEKIFEKIRDNRYKYCVSKLYAHIVVDGSRINTHLMHC